MGKAGDVEPEHKALLRINYVDERDYNSVGSVTKELADYLNKVGVKFLNENSSKEESLEEKSLEEKFSDLKIDQIVWEINPVGIFNYF